MEKYKFEVPEGISATEEIILRYGGIDGLHPIAYLLILAGYSKFVTIEDGGKLYPLFGCSDKIFCKDWAENHSEEWRRYQFHRWGELREEIWEGIKQRRNDPLELRNYIWSLLLPFKNFYYYDTIQLDIGDNCERLSLEVNLLVKEYRNQTFFSVKDFVVLWKRAVEKTLNEHDDSILSEYENALKYNLWVEKSNARMNDWLVNEEASAFTERSAYFPIEYASCIAGCLLGNNAEKEYMDYQEESGVMLVDSLPVSYVADAMDWTEQAVLACKPKRLMDLEEYEGYEQNVTSKTEKKCEAEIGTVSFGDIKKLPPVYQSKRASIILENAFAANFIDNKFNWLRRQGAFAYFIGKFHEWLFGPGDINWKRMEGWGDLKFPSQERSKFISRKFDKKDPERMEIDMIFSREKSVE